MSAVLTKIRQNKFKIKSINYDSKNDVLRLYFCASPYSFSYDEDMPHDVIISRAIEDGSVVAMLVFDYKIRDKVRLKKYYPDIPWEDVNIDFSRGSFAKGKYYKEKDI